MSFSFTTPGSLAHASKMIGDQWMAASAILFDENAGVLTVPFLYFEPGDELGLTQLAVLRVHTARRMEVSDPERVEVYSLGEIRLGPARNSLLVTAEPNLMIAIDVESVDVELEVFSALGPPRRFTRNVVGIRGEKAPETDGVEWLR